MMTRVNDAICTFFESIGVDPGTVPKSSLGTEGGYLTYNLDSSGNRANSWEGIPHIFHEWVGAEEILYREAFERDWEDGNCR